MARRSRSTLAERGYSYVLPTTEERLAYWKRSTRTSLSMDTLMKCSIPVDRVECKATGKRIWASGLGIGSHERACLADHRTDAAKATNITVGA